MVISFGCELDRVYSHLGNKALGMSLGVSSGTFNLGGRPTRNVGVNICYCNRRATNVIYSRFLMKFKVLATKNSSSVFSPNSVVHKEIRWSVCWREKWWIMSPRPEFTSRLLTFRGGGLPRALSHASCMLSETSSKHTFLTMHIFDQKSF